MKKKINDILTWIKTKMYGRAYYIVIIRNRYSLRECCVGHLFATRDDAENFCENIQYNTASEIGLEVHEIRSHKHFDTYEGV